MNSLLLRFGKTFGAMLLIAGCCIGAGMLGIPVLTAVTGFVPATFLFGISWLFMLVTGLLLLEVNLWFKEEVSLISMAEKTLGWFGKAACWIFFLFLFYCVMIAYTAGSGQLFADFVDDLTGVVIPDWISSSITSFLFGLIVYAGTFSVDRFNRILMGGLILTYLLLVLFGMPHIEPENLTYQHWTPAPFLIPAIIIGFGYHNLVPTLKNYLEGNRKKLKTAIFAGSLIPLIVYILWDAVILGLLPLRDQESMQQAVSQGEMASRTLRNAIGSGWIVELVEVFAFFAIVTSFLAVALSFVDFLADGLHIKKNQKGRIILCSLVIVPPLILSLAYPYLFLAALGFAGGFATVFLFGVIPALMVWSGRYRKNLGNHPILPGGKVTLSLVIIASLGIFLLELFHVFF